MLGYGWRTNGMDSAPAITAPDATWQGQRQGQVHQGCEGGHVAWQGRGGARGTEGRKVSFRPLAPPPSSPPASSPSGPLPLLLPAPTHHEEHVCVVQDEGQASVLHGKGQVFECHRQYAARHANAEADNHEDAVRAQVTQKVLGVTCRQAGRQAGWLRDNCMHAVYVWTIVGWPVPLCWHVMAGPPPCAGVSWLARLPVLACQGWRLAHPLCWRVMAGPPPCAGVPWLAAGSPPVLACLGWPPPLCWRVMAGPPPCAGVSWLARLPVLACLGWPTPLCWRAMAGGWRTPCAGVSWLDRPPVLACHGWRLVHHLCWRVLAGPPPCAGVSWLAPPLYWRVMAGPSACAPWLAHPLC